MERARNGASGSHMSAAGGLYKAVDAAAKTNNGQVQIFTHSPSQWCVKQIEKALDSNSDEARALHYWSVGETNCSYWNR